MTTAPNPPHPKVFIKTWGCQMNVYDSTRIQDALEQDGYEHTTDLEDADLVLLNTCHIREKAVEKVYSDLGRIRKVKNRRAETDRPLMVGVTGCVAQAEGREIIKREKIVDLVVGPQTYHRIGEVVRKAKTEGPQVLTEYAVEDKFEHMPLAKKAQVRSRGVAAFLTVQEGCDKFCTFCVVPYTRGAEVSRPSAQILTEARSFVDAGVREITLLGQNVNAWHGNSPAESKMGLGGLLHELAKIEGIERLRYVTSHPNDMDDSLIEAHRDLAVVMPYLHLPVQSGSDKILKAMNRNHTSSDYLAVIEKVRAARADIAISGDFIVGFPGETEEDFQATLDIVRKTKYAQAFSFKYSIRPGTPGADMKDQVDEDVKAERLVRLQALIIEQQIEFNQSCVDKTITVLLEKQAKTPHQLVGRSPWLQSVIVDADIGQIGEMVDVVITEAHPNSLQAVAVRKAA